MFWMEFSRLTGFNCCLKVVCEEWCGLVGGRLSRVLDGCLGKSFVFSKWFQQIPGSTDVLEFPTSSKEFLCFIMIYKYWQWFKWYVRIAKFKKGCTWLHGDVSGCTRMFLVTQGFARIHVDLVACIWIWKITLEFGKVAWWFEKLRCGKCFGDFEGLHCDPEDLLHFWVWGVTFKFGIMAERRGSNVGDVETTSSHCCPYQPMSVRHNMSC